MSTKRLTIAAGYPIGSSEYLNESDIVCIELNKRIIKMNVLHYLMWQMTKDGISVQEIMQILNEQYNIDFQTFKQEFSNAMKQGYILGTIGTEEKIYSDMFDKIKDLNPVRQGTGIGDPDEVIPNKQVIVELGDEEIQISILEYKLWRLCSGYRTVVEVRDAMKEEFEGAEQSVNTQLIDCLIGLMNKKLLYLV